MTAADSIRTMSLPSLAASADRVLHEHVTSEPDLARFVEVLEEDPGLAGRIVRLANSSLFGMGATVQTVHQAVLVLGLRVARLAAVSYSLIRSFPKESSDARLGELWRRCLINAVAARMLAERLGRDGEEAFVAGLLQDSAMLLMADKLGKRYFDLLDDCRMFTPAVVAEREHAAFGTSHAHLGGRMLAEWKLEPTLIEAVQHHHLLSAAEVIRRSQSDLTSCLTIVESLTALLTQPTLGHYGEWLAIASEFGHTELERERFLHRVELQVAELADLLALTLPETPSFHRLLREAKHEAESGGAGGGKVRDSDTELLHRDGLEARLRQELSQARRQQWPLAALMIRVRPIEHLESVGHWDEARRVRRLASEVIKAAVRESDTAFRYASETFFVLLPNTNEQGADVLVDRLVPKLNEIDLKRGTFGQFAHAMVAIITVRPESASSLEQVLRESELTLNQALSLAGRSSKVL